MKTAFITYGIVMGIGESLVPSFNFLVWRCLLLVSGGPYLDMDTLFYTGITQSLLIQMSLGLTGLDAAIII